MCETILLVASTSTGRPLGGSIPEPTPVNRLEHLLEQRPEMRDETTHDELDQSVQWTLTVPFFVPAMFLGGQPQSYLIAFHCRVLPLRCHIFPAPP